MLKTTYEREVHAYESYLRTEEKSNATVQKYLHDVDAFLDFLGGRELEKELVIDYKNRMQKTHAVTSVNAMLAALNGFFRFLGSPQLCVKPFRIQKTAFCTEEKELSREEYVRLLNTAKKRGNERLYLLLQTICSTGIRVSELRYITVESVRRGEACVSCKGKTRHIFLTMGLQKKLLRYIRKKRIVSGSVFITRGGKPISRHNVWRDMKSLCKQAGVLACKVFPHNLRHLFARSFYAIDKDIAKLADLLGHTTVNTTRIYLTTTGAEHRKRMEHLHLIL